MIKNNYFKKTVSFIAVTAAMTSLLACQGKHNVNNYPASNSGYTMNSAASTLSSSSTMSTASACSASSSSSSSYISSGPKYFFDEEFNTEEYDSFDENRFKSVSMSPLSTFSADIDTASYANVRRMINTGYAYDAIPKGAVRVEEMINYFSYDYAGPAGDQPFGVNAEISDCPWNEDNKLLRIGLQTESIKPSECPAANIVFLIDVSGSMNDRYKLDLVKESIDIMLDNLDKKDRVSIVTYCGGVDVAAEGLKGSHKNAIKRVVDSLKTGGSTNGEGGLLKAYEIAEKYYIEGGNNRIILASDGDFNVGRTSQSDLVDIVEEKREKGIYMTVLGFGMGNYSDARMETIADKGNGNYAYIDTVLEAKKVLSEEFSANMVTVAKDVKFQVEFNPAYVSEYRLIGYENRALNDEDFEDDKKDAGEIGAGHSVTVLYEIVPASEESTDKKDLKYQSSVLTKEALESDEWLTLSIRYKKPDEEISRLLEYNIGSGCCTDKPSDDFLFAASVAEFGMLLKNSEYLGNASFKHVQSTLTNIRLDDVYKKEFYDLVEKLDK